MIALFLTFCFTAEPTCHEQLAGRFASFAECQAAATTKEAALFKEVTYDEQGAVLKAMSCRPVK